MPHQVDYYNRFGSQFRESILACPEPHLWTTDYAVQGPVYKVMKERVQRQEKLIQTYFTPQYSVLDIGCGFGRQACLLGRLRYTVTGIDTSEIFIQLAKELFSKHGYSGTFICGNLLTDDLLSEQYTQVILFDVLEHIPPHQRKAFVSRIASICAPEAMLIISLPGVKNRFSSKLNNRVRRQLTQHFPYFFEREEHPYPIPEGKDVENLFTPHFSIIDKQRTSDTYFYVLKRLG